MEYFTVIFRFASYVLALFPILYLALFKNKNRTTRIFFIFLISYPAPILHQIITHSYLWDKYPRLFFLPLNFFFLTMPFFYLHVKSLFGKLNKKEIVLFSVPGILEFLFMLTLFCLPTEITVAFAKNNKMFFPVLFGLILPVFSLTLTYLTFVKVHKFYHKNINFLSDKQKANLRWIKYMCITLSVNYLFMFSALFMEDIWMELIDSFVTIFCLYLISIYSIREFHIPSEFPAFNNKHTTIDAEDFERIKSVLDTSKVFTNPNLTVDDLSELVNLHPRRVSQLINYYAGINFNQLINKYRIEESKKLLSDKRYSNLTMEGIAKEAGFNSRSVFNQVFKSQIGLTPRDFKQQAMDPI